VIGDGSAYVSPNDSGRLTRRAMLARAVGAAAAVAMAPHLENMPVLAAPEDVDREIWDGHVHLNSGVTGPVEKQVDELLNYADRLGIVRLIVSFRNNDEVLKAIAYSPRRIMGFVYVDPKQTEAGLRDMDRCVRDGPMLGVKLGHDMQCSRPELDAIVRRAVELKAPILQHCFWNKVGTNPNESNPDDLVALAARHPEASFICAHTGGDWERGIRTLRRSNNILAELCGSDPTAGFVETAVRELGAERVTWGSDGGGRSFASQLAKVLSANLPEEAKRRILGGNLRRLLKPIFEKKGVRL
jgi:predicted TIM-barrel fold metal-dependent hydrolase